MLCVGWPGDCPLLPLTNPVPFFSPFLCLPSSLSLLPCNLPASSLGFQVSRLLGGWAGGWACPPRLRAPSPPRTGVSGSRSPGSGPPSWPPGLTCGGKRSPPPVWGSRGCEASCPQGALRAWRQYGGAVRMGQPGTQGGVGLLTLTFFRATNSFSAVARSATSSSYLRWEGRTGRCLSSSQLGHEARLIPRPSPCSSLRLQKTWGRTKKKSGCLSRPAEIHWRTEVPMLTSPLIFSVGMGGRAGSGSLVCAHVHGCVCRGWGSIFFAQGSIFLSSAPGFAIDIGNPSQSFPLLGSASTSQACHFLLLCGQGQLRARGRECGGLASSWLRVLLATPGNQHPIAPGVHPPYPVSHFMTDGLCRDWIRPASQQTAGPTRTGTVSTPCPWIACTLLGVCLAPGRHSENAG